jgi:hypothetical protein
MYLHPPPSRATKHSISADGFHPLTLPFETSKNNPFNHHHSPTKKIREHRRTRFNQMFHHLFNLQHVPNPPSTPRLNRWHSDPHDRSQRSHPPSQSRDHRCGSHVLHWSPGLDGWAPGRLLGQPPGWMFNGHATGTDWLEVPYSIYFWPIFEGRIFRGYPHNSYGQTCGTVITSILGSWRSPMVWGSHGDDWATTIGSLETSSRGQIRSMLLRIGRQTNVGTS